MVYLVVFALLLLLYFWLFKIPKLGVSCLVTGAVKSGKSTFSVHVSIRSHKRALWGYCYARALRVLLYPVHKLKRKNKPVPELPFLYANIPLKYAYYRPLTKSVLLRKQRLPYKSVIYCGEVSLVADSMCFKDEITNEELLLWNKLVGHELHGGKLIYDTQSVDDCHYAIKRTLTQYLYIHHMVKIPLFPWLIMYVRECRYSSDSTNVYNEDLEKTLQRVIVPKKVWKKFDCYCYSCLTDDLPISGVGREGAASDLKARKIISFKKYLTLRKRKEDENEVLPEGK